MGFKVRRAGEGDGARGGVNRQARIAAGLKAVGSGTGGGVFRIGRGGGVDQLACSTVLVDRSRCGAAGDRGCYFVQVVDGQRDHFLCRVVGSVGGHDREAVAGLGFKVRRAGEGDGARGGVNRQARIAAGLKAVGSGTGGGVFRIGRGGGVDQLACSTVLVDRSRCGAAGDRGCYFVQVVDGQRDHFLCRVVGRISGDHREAVAGFGLEVRVAGKGDDTRGAVDAQQRRIAAACLEAVRGVAGGGVAAVC